MAKEAAGAREASPGIIVRHTSRRIGELDVCEACWSLIEGRISFSEFVDQVGEDYRELLEFMMEHDLHPGRREEVLFCIECYEASGRLRALLRRQLELLYRNGRGVGGGVRG
ncbi:hypothetical protein RxyAA322_04210 [Rubrobacter xylanophilus]|uniref:Uncharacterized protein n=1 Tax=Rubrobacter xylanophilus TaxID=49319 RepID=A0A510HJR2_9ACTN|nr:hypothetical protein [Rubrobacter xylanophilus]BBL78567.1 hypothetical protein RxyAA322_04210 [Rubrobacter xylanophilus]